MAQSLNYAIYFVWVLQLRNSQHRSVSGSAENCTLLGIPSLSTAIRCAGFAVEGDGGRGSKVGMCFKTHVN